MNKNNNPLTSIVNIYHDMLKEFNGDKDSLNRYLERNEVANYVITIHGEYSMYEHAFKCRKGNLEKRKEQELNKVIKKLIKDGEIDKMEVFQYSCKEIKQYW